jgi:hypothetical protein
MIAGTRFEIVPFNNWCADGFTQTSGIKYYAKIDIACRSANM